MKMTKISNFHSLGTLSIKFFYLFIFYDFFLFQTVDSDAFAQVVPDQSLSSSTIVERIGQTKKINGGRQINKNLFHSFSSFSIQKDESAHFNNEPSIINIFARVTGNSYSKIDGIINTNGSSNLFLLNPKGIIFGPNSRLNIGGSFLATTADSIQFNNGFEFSSSKKNSVSLLSIHTPLRLNFLTNPRNITIQSREGLSVKPNRSISLIGGPVNLDGSSLIAPDGRIEVGSVNSNQTVSLSQSLHQQNMAGGFDEAQYFNDISLSNLALVDTSGTRGGDIHFFGRNIILKEGSRIQSITLGSNNGGKIKIHAYESLSLFGNNNISGPIDERFARFGLIIPQKTSILASTLGDGQSASIEIFADKLSISDGADISTATDSLGSAGKISIAAPSAIKIYGETSLIQVIPERIPFNNPFTRAFLIDASISSTIRSRTALIRDGGNGGSIQISAGKLTLENGGNIASGSDRGQGGSVNITASGDIEIFGSTKSGAASSFITSATSFSNNASPLSINARNLILRDGGVITVSTFSEGQGGDINISTSESVILAGLRRDRQFSSQINSGSFGSGNAGSIEITTKNFIIKDGAEISASAVGLGTGGNISIKARSINITNGGKLQTSSAGLGDAGDIRLNAAESVQIKGQNSGLFANTQNIAQGGSIIVRTRDFKAINGGTLVTSTAGSQPAGNIKLTVRESIVLDGTNSGLFANTEVGSTSIGGDITIDPRIVRILNGAQVSVNSKGNGPAGSINLVSGNLTLDRGTLSAASSTNTGGNISLFIDNLLLLRNQSLISTTASGNGRGGNIDIDAKLVVAFPSENSDIAANAFQGQGGRIFIKSKGVFGIKERKTLTNLSDITAVSNNTELNGVVEINTPDVDPSENLYEQPQVIKNIPVVTKGCRAGQTIGSSSFVHTGRGGLPSNPYKVQTPNSVWQDLRTYKLPVNISSSQRKNISTLDKKKDHVRFVEANGWKRDSHGRIRLISFQTKGSSNQLQVNVDC